MPPLLATAEYRMLSAPALSGRPVVAGPTPFHAILPHGLRGVDGCRGSPDALPRPTQPFLAPLLASPALRLHGASFVLHVLQHTAAAAGLHGQCRVSCQLAAGLVWCVVLAQLAAAPLGGRRRSVAALASLRLLLTGWLLV